MTVESLERPYPIKYHVFGKGPHLQPLCDQLLPSFLLSPIFSLSSPLPHPFPLNLPHPIPLVSTSLSLHEVNWRTDEIVDAPGFGLLTDTTTLPFFFNLLPIIYTLVLLFSAFAVCETVNLSAFDLVSFVL